jgi:DNA-binding NtrC family response regulator
MARVALEVHEPANRITLKAMLEAEGHEIVAAEPQVTLCDDLNRAVELAAQGPAVLALVNPADVREAVQAMRKGVYGYILVPFLPGEAPLMVDRACGRATVPDEDNGRILSLEEAEMQHIQHVLRRCKGNQAEAARVLGIGRNTLWRKLKRARPASPPPQEPDAGAGT